MIRSARFAALMAAAGSALLWSVTACASAYADTQAVAPPVASTNGAGTAVGGDGLPPGPAPYVTDYSYRIAPEDVLSIQIVNHPEANFSTSVMPDGTINYPHIGQKKVAGLKAVDLEQMITRALTGNGNPKMAIYLHPEVRVFVTSRQVRMVNVIGTAFGEKNPGKIAYKDGSRIFDTLATAGFSTDRPDFYQAQLIRPAAPGSGDAPQVSDIDLAQVFDRKTEAGPDHPGAVGDISVLPDDTIVINSKDVSRVSVQVIGEVGKPGLIPCPRDGSLATVLGQAQPSPKALLSGAKIERNGQEIAVDLSRWFRDGKVDTDVALQPGDRLVIPANQRVYAIYGALGHSGTQIYPDDKKMTLLTAWADAGGSTEGLELKDVSVIRPNPAGGAPTIIKRDLKDMIKNGRIDEDVSIQPNDIIVIPAAKRRKGVDPGQALGVVGAIPTLAWLFRGHF